MYNIYSIKYTLLVLYLVFYCTPLTTSPITTVIIVTAIIIIIAGGSAPWWEW